MLENESALRDEGEVRARVRRIWSVMNESIERGLHTEGILPGGLKVRRRAPRLYKKLSERSRHPIRSALWIRSIFLRWP